MGGTIDISQPLAPNFLIQRVSSASNVKPDPMVINAFLCVLPLAKPIIFLALSEPPQIQGRTVNQDNCCNRPLIARGCLSKY